MAATMCAEVCGGAAEEARCGGMGYVSILLVWGEECAAGKESIPQGLKPTLLRAYETQG